MHIFSKGRTKAEREREREREREWWDSEVILQMVKLNVISLVEISLPRPMSITDSKALY